MTEEAPRYLTIDADPDLATAASDAGKCYAVLRIDRAGVPTFCATLDEARALAAGKVAGHGGGCWVFRLVGTVSAIASWLPEPDGNANTDEEPAGTAAADPRSIYP